MEERALNNTTASQAKENVSDLEIWGDGDAWKLICKASSKKQGWMKSTKAMEVHDMGCIVQVTTQQLNETGVPLHMDTENGMPKFSSSETYKESVITDAVTWVPGVYIEEKKDDAGKVTSRRLASLFSRAAKSTVDLKG